MRAHTKHAVSVKKTGTRQFSERLVIPGNDSRFVRMIVDMIMHAEKQVALSSYLLQDGPIIDALLSCAHKGIFVTVLTASAEELDTCEELSLFEETVLKNHAGLLNRIAGHILVRTSSEYHAKFLVVDPIGLKSAGILMTCNMTEDAMTGNNIEAAIILNSDEVRSLFSFYLHGFWELGRHELFEAGVLSAVTSVPSLTYQEISVPVTVSGITTLKDAIISVIASATERIDISCWTFMHQEISDLLCARASAGLKITLYVHIPEYIPLLFSTLAASGIQIYGNARMHAKTVIADLSHGLLMTANISEFGLDSGFDAGIYVNNGAEELISEISSACIQSYSRTANAFSGTSASGKSKRMVEVKGEKVQPSREKPEEKKDVVLSVLNSYLSERRKEFKK